MATEIPQIQQNNLLPLEPALTEDDVRTLIQNTLLNYGGNLKVSPQGDVSAASMSITKRYTAGMRINKGEAVFIHTDGKIYSTDASLATMTSGYLGFATDLALTGMVCPVKTFGNNTGLTGLTIQSTYYLSNATQTQDQAQTSNDAYVAIDASRYQSFTTGANVTEISSVSLMLETAGGSDTQTITIDIRSGTGVGGSIVATVSKSTAYTATPTFYNYIFSIPVVLSANTVYSICPTTGGGTPKWSYKSGTNPYSGGTADSGGPPAVNSDYGFKTFYSTSRGSIGTGAGTISKKVGFATSATELEMKDSL